MFIIHVLFAGGHPVFSPKFKQSIHLKCETCLTRLGFIFQIYCPVDNFKIDRVLYFYHCLNSPQCPMPKCVVLRVITDQISSETENQTGRSNDNLFDDSWDTDDVVSESTKETQSSSADQLVDQLETKLQIDTEPKFDISLEPSFEPYYISVFEEPMKVKTLDLGERKRLEQVEKSLNEEGQASGSKSSLNEQYEKSYSQAFADNHENYRFFKRLRRCPEQLLRYQWCGQPLMSCNREVNASKCSSCGSLRVFEFQIMPSMITTLVRIRKSTEIDVGLDFETILVYTCGSNCRNQESIEEQSFVFKELYLNQKQTLIE